MGQKDTCEQQEHERWTRLLAWMETKGYDASQTCVELQTRKGAGRGLVAIKTLHPSKKPFLVIPAAALLNIRTLSSIYPAIYLEGFVDCPSSDDLILNGTQLLSIHLALYRPLGDSYSKDPKFGPYIDTLPRVFDSHPLSWIVTKKLGKAAGREARLLENLPPSVLRELLGVAKRFWQDWDVAMLAKEKYIDDLKAKNEALFSLHDFLWGWLVVNTRSLYSDIFRRKLPLSNLTLCPLIDFANHTNSTHLARATWKDAPKDARARRGGEVLKAHDYVFLPPEQIVKEGEEIFLQYGRHSNRTLFAEYGFVDEHSDQEVDVTDLVDKLIESNSVKGLIKKLLPEAAHQFMSDLKLHAVPPPEHPSWGLQNVLRLINLKFRSDRDVGTESVEVEKMLQPWRDVILGQTDLVSEGNELLVRCDLEAICKIIISRSLGNIFQLQVNEAEEYTGIREWYEWAQGCVVKLWEEETRVARGVSKSIADGQVF